MTNSKPDIAGDLQQAGTLPPPPPALDPLPSALQLRVLVGLFASGVVAFVVGLVIASPVAPLVQRGGVFGAVYALVVAASWLPANGPLAKRIDVLLDKWVRGSATGYYGMMALATFTHLEMQSALDAVTGFFAGLEQMFTSPISWVVEALKDSLMNLVWGFAWPGDIFQNRAGLAPVVLVVLTLGVFRLGSKLLPHATFAGPKRYKKKKSKPVR
jgi:hypothetical protein